MPIQQRQEKAAQIGVLARTLRDKVKMACGDVAVSYYIHCAVQHLPGFTERLPIEIIDASGSGIEMANQRAKRALL